MVIAGGVSDMYLMFMLLIITFFRTSFHKRPGFLGSKVKIDQEYGSSRKNMPKGMSLHP